MKKLSWSALLLMLVASFVISCSDSDTDVVTPDNNQTEEPDDPNDDPNDDPDDPNTDPDDPNTDPDDPNDDPDVPTVQDLTYLDAMATYMGTDKIAGLSTFQVQMAPKSLVSVEAPLHYCFLQLTAGPVTDLENLKLQDGEYNILEGTSATPMTFYPTVAMGDGFGGSVIIEITEAEGEKYGEIVDGKVVVENTSDACNISGTLVLADGRTINFTYSGLILLRDQSGEGGEPAGEAEIPVSTLTEDVTFTADPKECYYSHWSQYFADYPKFDYFMIQLCKDDTYAETLTIVLLVDRTAYADEVLPAGKYYVMNRSQQEWETMTLATLESFRITTDSDPYIEIGSMYQTDYQTFHSLVGGEVTVHSFDPTTRQIDMSWALTTNGTPVTVSGRYAGKLIKS